MAVATAAVMGLFLLATVVAAAAVTSRVRPEHVAWIAGGVPGEAAREVYHAYLHRHHNARFAGCLAGLVVAALASWRWNDELVLRVGIGDGPIGADLLVGALAGMTLGTLAAETYRLHPSPRGARQARLDVRPPRPEPRLTRIARGLVLVAVALAVVGIARGDLGPLGGAVLAVGIGLLAEITQRAITDRRRPTDQSAAEVDARLRAFAGTSVAWLQLSGAVLGLGWAVSATDLPAVAAPVQVVLVLASLVVALVSLVRSAVRPPRGWTPGVVA